MELAEGWYISSGSGGASGTSDAAHTLAWRVQDFDLRQGGVDHDLAQGEVVNTLEGRVRRGGRGTTVHQRLARARRDGPAATLQERTLG